jgi:deoxyribose-phosphate aldolase
MPKTAPLHKGCLPDKKTVKKMKQYIEHTRLHPCLTEAEVMQLVEETLQYGFVGLCVPPYWVKKVRREVADQAAVVTVVGFPLGYQRSEVKAQETQMALADGATEIDMVFSLTAFKSGMDGWAKAEVAQLAKICHQSEAMLKVIIETAYLSDQEIVRACMLCTDAGADFVKTSTGFAPAGATVEHIRLMRQTVGAQLGVKASGGIRDLAQAQAMIDAGADRIGTSAGVAIIQAWQAAQ